MSLIQWSQNRRILALAATAKMLEPMGGTFQDASELARSGITAQRTKTADGLTQYVIPQLGLSGQAYKSTSGLDLLKQNVLAPALPAIGGYLVNRALGSVQSRMQASGGRISQQEQVGLNFLTGLSQGAVPWMQQQLGIQQSYAAPAVQMRGYAPNIQTQLPFLGGGYYGY